LAQGLQFYQVMIQFGFIRDLPQLMRSQMEEQKLLQGEDHLSNHFHSLAMNYLIMARYLKKNLSY
jgi:hypothetical protein